MSLFRELQRRNVFRAVVAYAVGGWLVIEGMDIATETFEAPDWVMQVTMSIVLIGLLPVGLFSWLFEITPDGIRRETDDAPAHSAGSQRKLDMAILVMLAVAIALLAIDLSDNESIEPVFTQSSQPGVSDRPMLAVLPFIATSLDGDSEFFASGMHDDLLTQLAQLRSIRVISRTSVWEYRDTTRNIKDIGEALGADAILEGRVQSASGQIRINAQLIDAKTDEHLWARTYDRSLTTANIFELQSEIAHEITGALHATLSSEESALLNTLPTDNMVAYRAFHEALAVRDAPNYDVAAFTALLEGAIELDPAFTRALAELVGSYTYQQLGDKDPALVLKAEEKLEQIARLAPNSTDHLIAQAYYTYYVLRDYESAFQLITRAEEQAPSDIRLLQLKSWIQRRRGNIEDKIATLRVIRSLDPRSPRWVGSIVFDLMALHRYEDARDEVARAAVRDYTLAHLSILLNQQADPDPSRRVDETRRLIQEFDHQVGSDLFDALVADRQFGAAFELVEASPELFSQRRGLSTTSYRKLLAARFMGDNALLERLLIEARSEPLDEYWGLDWDLALLAALEGDADKAETHLRRMRRILDADYAELMGGRIRSCRIYGLASLAEPTARCLSEAFVEPSTALPFVESGLPYYDTVRNSPEFVALVNNR
jgi:TolB-like protein